MKRASLAALCAAGSFGCAPFSITDAQINSTSLGSGLPAGFLLGVATSSFQTEGGLDNDWTDWALAGHVDNGDTVGNAVDSWNRFPTDLGLIQHLGADTYRFSVDWSRLEPTEGAFDPGSPAALQYLSWATQLRAAGIEPMVTVYHFALPKWVRDQGGWTNDKTTADLVAFAGRVADLLGGQVDYWCTLNEPNGVAIQGYIIGEWPPGEHNQQLAAEVLGRLMDAHAGMSAALRAHDQLDADGVDGKATQIGLTTAVRVFQPATPTLLDGTIAALTDDFTNEAVLRAVATGRFTASAPGLFSVDRVVPGLQSASDFIGVQYYLRNHIRADLGDPSLSQQYAPAGRTTSDLGWDIYPEGLYQSLKRVSLLGLPIIITENGMADASGLQRPRYLRSHMVAVERAIAEGVDLRGYIHWSLLDNFELADGWSPKFGLYSVDLATYARSETPAVNDFRAIAANAGKVVPP